MANDLRTFGVEEEYLLLDAETGLPSSAADDLMAALPDLELEHEFFQSQLEVATPVCRTADEALAILTEFRRRVQRAAAGRGLLLASTGLPPLGSDVAGSVSEVERYQRIAAHHGHLVATYYSTGTHVHVAVPSRDDGVRAMGLIARWAAVLMALTVNSPIALGERTGFESWRYPSTLNWHTAGYPPYFASGDEYSVLVEQLFQTGVLLDRALVNWSVRLAERYPTIEFRLADAQLEASDSVAYAALMRALVGRVLGDDTAGDAEALPSRDLVRGAIWAAARDGLSGDIVDASKGEAVPAADAVHELLAYVEPELEANGDLEFVRTWIEGALSTGAGAGLQRRALETGGVPALLDLYRCEA